jgi:hypothetical protein
MDRQEAILWALREGVSEARRKTLAAGRDTPSVEDVNAIHEYIRQKVPGASSEEPVSGHRTNFTSHTILWPMRRATRPMLGMADVAAAMFHVRRVARRCKRA